MRHCNHRVMRRTYISASIAAAIDNIHEVYYETGKEITDESIH